MSAEHAPPPLPSAPEIACWRTIGVEGDGSCDQLAAAIHCRNCAVFAAAGGRLFERSPPTDYVAEQTARYSATADDVGGQSEPLLLFRLGDEWFALPVATVVEVAAPRRVHRIPHRTDRVLLGIINLRGELQLCASLRELLGIVDEAPAAGTAPRNERGSERLLVCDLQGARWAVPVDEVAGVERFAPEATARTPTTVAKRTVHFTVGLITWQSRRVGKLDADRVAEALRHRVG
jgi:chemotaxis-related protein WspD